MEEQVDVNPLTQQTDVMSVETEDITPMTVHDTEAKIELGRAAVIQKDQGPDHTHDPDPGVIVGGRQDLTRGLVAGHQLPDLRPEVQALEEIKEQTR